MQLVIGHIVLNFVRQSGQKGIARG